MEVNTGAAGKNSSIERQACASSRSWRQESEDAMAFAKAAGFAEGGDVAAIFRVHIAPDWWK